MKLVCLVRDGAVRREAAFLLTALAAHGAEARVIEAPLNAEGVDAVAEARGCEPDVLLIWGEADLAEKALSAPDGSRVVFVAPPGVRDRCPPRFWAAARDRRRCRVIAFGWPEQERAWRIGAWSARFAYFADPAEATPVRFEDGLRVGVATGAWPAARAALGDALDDASVASIHVAVEEQAALDAPAGATLCDPGDPALERATVAFPAPRAEGIDHALLSALARGACVAAAERSAMAPALTHGLTGRLYDAAAPAPWAAEALTLETVERIGRAGREMAARGAEAWRADADRLAAAVLDDHLDLDAAAPRERAFWLRATAAPARRARASASAAAPRITVATVTFNPGADLAPTLQSIAAQSYPAMETLVVDGGSTDGTLDALESASELVDRWISEPDSGPYDAMNKAARLAEGAYLLFMNAGDFFAAPDALAMAAEAVRAAPAHPDFVTGHHIFTDADGVPSLQKTAPFDDLFAALRDGAVSEAWHRRVPCHQATLTRRDYLTSVGGYDPRFPIAADHGVLFAAAAAGARFAAVDAPLAIYTGGGLSQRRAAQCAHDWWRILSEYAPAEAIAAFFRATYGAEARFAPETFAAERARVAASGAFAAEWYRATHMRGLPRRLDPIGHYLGYGAAAGLDPSPWFDAARYAALTPEARDEPLAHALNHRAASLRDWRDSDDPSRIYAAHAAEVGEDPAALIQRILYEDEDPVAAARRG